MIHAYPLTSPDPWPPDRWVLQKADDQVGSLHVDWCLDGGSLRASLEWRVVAQGFISTSREGGSVCTSAELIGSVPAGDVARLIRQHFEHLHPHLGVLVDPFGLPDRVRVMGFWALWASAIAAGVKTIETRTWPWPYPSGWLAVHASKRLDGPVLGRVEPFPDVPPVERGALCCLAFVGQSRFPLLPTDRDRALRYHPDLWAWDIRRVHRLAPVHMRGPQKFSSVPRSTILGALA